MQDMSGNGVFNAFIMPFRSNSNEMYEFVGVATADWEEYSVDTKNYAYVLGILVDTKRLISGYYGHDEKEIEKLSKLIENSLQEYKRRCMHE